MDKYNEYVSDDKMTIKLPVPLGTILYRMCNKDKCVAVPSECNRTKHTNCNGIRKFEFNLGNIEKVLKGYGETIFASECELLDIIENK